MAQIETDLLADIVDAAADLNPGDSMSPKVLRAIAQHLGPRDVRRSVETGAGGSTLLLSHLSSEHTAFAIEGNNRIITRLKSSMLLRRETTEFIEGPTQRTLPRQMFDRSIQVVLIDGPHAFPFPQLEYYYLYPNIANDGLLILDDIHIPTIHELYRSSALMTCLSYFKSWNGLHFFDVQPHPRLIHLATAGGFSPTIASAFFAVPGGKF